MAGKSRHIHIRYFFTKDVLKRENMSVEHCATEDMIADFYTKPLQGKQFYRWRNLIMGNSKSTVQECVGNSDKVTTVENAKKTVSRNTSRIFGSKYKVSNNFD